MHNSKSIINPNIFISLRSENPVSLLYSDIYLSFEFNSFVNRTISRTLTDSPPVCRAISLSKDRSATKRFNSGLWLFT